MLHHPLGYFERIPASPFGLHQMKSQLITFRWRVYPGSQAAAADKFITLFFKNGPVLNAVFVKTGYFGSHFFLYFFITKRSTKKGHDVGIPPKASSQLKVIFFPGTEEQSVRAEDFHRKT